MMILVGFLLVVAVSGSAKLGEYRRSEDGFRTSTSQYSDVTSSTPRNTWGTAPSNAQVIEAEEPCCAFSWFGRKKKDLDLRRTPLLDQVSGSDQRIRAASRDFSGDLSPRGLHAGEAFMIPDYPISKVNDANGREMILVLVKVKEDGQCHFNAAAAALKYAASSSVEKVVKWPAHQIGDGEYEKWCKLSNKWQSL